jgi:monoamine oxidase
MDLYDVAIVGAGLAGLAACDALERRGARTCLLEARTRVGGRVLSRSGTIERQTIDLGGELVGSFHSAVRSLAKTFGLTMRCQSHLSAELIPDALFIQGHWARDSKIAQLRMELRELIDELVELAIHVDVECPWESGGMLPQLDAVSVDEWLLARRTSPALCSLFSDLAPGTQSMLALLSLIAGGGGNEFFYGSECSVIEGGSGRLADALARRVSHRLILGARVIRLEVNRHQVQVTYQSGQGIQEAVANAVLLAVPCSVLNLIGGMVSMPLLPRMSSNGKLTLFVQLGSRDDLEERLILTDTPCRTLQITRTEPHVARVDVLVCPHLRSSEGVPLDLNRFAATLCGLPSAKILEHHSFEWARDEFSRGSYAVFGRGCLRPSFEAVARSNRNVVFAGDYVVPAFAGYMEGAIQSGTRAADCICRDRT